MIKPWRSVRSNTPQSFRIFSIRTETAVSPRTGTEHDFYIIESRDWVNVIPVTPDRSVVMIRQYRHGQGKVTLEIPGGLVDPGDTPQEAATRELLEETVWENYGRGLNPGCENCQCHAGFETAALLATSPKAGDFWKMLAWQLGGRLGEKREGNHRA